MKLPSQRQLFLSSLKLHQAIYENSRGVLGHRLFLGMPTLLLRTTGRKTGQPRTNALVYGRDGANRMVVASNGGHHKPPAWLLNLEADPQVEIQVGVKTHPVTATALRPGDPDYDRLFAICNKANHGTFAKYQVKTDRPLPVIVFSPR
jgi:deazaflavin-dependent oxidoreductase (nitroreductase family)